MDIIQQLMNVTETLSCYEQRFVGTEPIEEVTEQVRTVKIEDKPKETEVIDEVQLYIITCRKTWHN